jgi:hypothetical protein
VLRRLAVAVKRKVTRIRQRSQDEKQALKENTLMMKEDLLMHKFISYEKRKLIREQQIARDKLNAANR